MTDPPSKNPLARAEAAVDATAREGLVELKRTA
jgi:hypothetical protein